MGALLAVQLGVCGLVCLAAAAAAGDLEAPAGGAVWSALIVTSLVASALGFFVQTFAQRHAPPARTALILASEPAFAGLFGWLIGDEHLSAVAWLGRAPDPGRDRGGRGRAAAAHTASAAGRLDTICYTKTQIFSDSN